MIFPLPKVGYVSFLEGLRFSFVIIYLFSQRSHPSARLTACQLLIEPSAPNVPMEEIRLSTWCVIPLFTGLYLSQLVSGNSAINSTSGTFAQQTAKNLRIYPSRLWCLSSAFLTTYLWWKKSVVWDLVVFFLRSVVWRCFVLFFQLLYFMGFAVLVVVYRKFSRVMTPEIL